MLNITNLKVEVEGKVLLSEFNLQVKEGEIHAIMGPNGAGKSTLSKVLSGHPKYKVTEGQIFFEGNNLLEMSAEKRSLMGLFVSFQYPLEIAGISNFEFLHTCYNARKKVLGDKEVNKESFQELLSSKMAFLQMKKEFTERNINEGFSGGEKKKNEVLQMSLFSPKLSILDEIDSGVDIDALKIISENINSLKTGKNCYVLITHYQRLLNYIVPDFIHILMDGRLVKTGGKELAEDIEKYGYEFVVNN